VPSQRLAREKPAGLLVAGVASATRGRLCPALGPRPEQAQDLPVPVAFLTLEPLVSLIPRT